MKKILLLCAALCSIGSLVAATTNVESPAEKRASIMRINEENPNNCLVVTDMFFEQDSIPTYKTDYEYDSNRELSAMYNYEMVDTGWFCYSYGFYEYLYLPNDTTNIGYTHNWDYELNTWGPTVGHKTQVLTNGNTIIQHKWETLPGDTTQWIDTEMYETTYNAAGQSIEGTQYLAENGQLVPSFKFESEYNAAGERILNISYTWMDDEWKLFEKDEIIVTDTTYFKGSYSHDENYTTLVLMNSVFCRFDANGDTLLYIWGADGERVYMKMEYTYENGLLQSKDVYREANYYPYNLVLTEQHYYQYDAQNRVREEKALNYSVGSVYIGYRVQTTYVSATSDFVASTLVLDSLPYDDQWYPRERREYTYTPSGYTSLKLAYGYSREDEAWHNMSKYEAVYNDDDMELFDALYYWDSDRNMWHGDYKHETEYNEEGVPVSSISYIMFQNDTVWVPEHAVVRTFDIYGNFLGEGWYGLDKETGAWVNLGKQLLVYVCGDIPTPAQPVVVDPGHDFVTFAWLSYENANTYTLTILSASMTDTIAIMNFNSFGELVGEKAFQGPRRSAAMVSSSSVFTCLIEGLNAATQYVFIMEAKDEDQQVVHTEQGNFSTDGYTGIESVAAPNTNAQKVFINGSLFIRCGENLYTPQGQQLR